jgi:hypothetical protein
VSAAARPIVRRERWRPAFRGYQRMRIVTEGDQLSIEAELDGPIAVGFEHWREANAFLDRIVADQIGVFI